jgi:Uma2 family endonuclease
MSEPHKNATIGFGERTQEPFQDIPIEPDAFLRWSASLDRRHPYKYELSAGRVRRMMIRVSRAHSLVTTNLLGELLAKLDRTRFHAGVAEFGVKTADGVRYPDVVVDRASADLKALACEAPIFIAEVLSPSTMGLDFTEKLDEYAAIASVQTYLICSQDEPRAWAWARQPDGALPRQPVEFVGRQDSVPLGGLGIELAMAGIFRGIPDPPTAD